MASRTWAFSLATDAFEGTRKPTPNKGFAAVSHIFHKHPACARIDLLLFSKSCNEVGYKQNANRLQKRVSGDTLEKLQMSSKASRWP